MNKEEILRKSREDYSENDEMLKEHQKSIRPIFAAVLVAAFFLFWLEKKYLEGELISESVMIMAWAVISAEWLYSFYLSRKKLYLVLGILGALDSVLKGYELFETVKNLV
ncbi:MAG: hypothetical protein IJO22_06820 [Oscillospiraceae bacterium]|nr:hypothetical protein [Oscillospiraceae bacterium]